MVLVQIQDEVVLRSKPNFSQKWLVPFHAESLSFREYRDRSTVSVSSNLQDVFLSPTRLSTSPPPLPPLFLPLDRSTILTRIYIGRESTTLVFLERKKERERTHGCIRDRGISSSSKIGNQCGFTDGAFVRDRQLDKVRRR